MANGLDQLGRIVDVPLYVQIAESLLERIESAEIKPGSKLPSERNLSSQFNVTRTTVRHALSVLEDRGLLLRQHGSGTFVADLKHERHADRLVGFSHDMRQQGHKPSAYVIEVVCQTATRSQARYLERPVGTPVYFVHRLRHINGEPAMIAKSVLPADRFPSLEQYETAPL